MLCKRRTGFFAYILTLTTNLQSAVLLNNETAHENNMAKQIYSSPTFIQHIMLLS